MAKLQSKKTSENTANKSADSTQNANDAQVPTPIAATVIDAQLDNEIKTSFLSYAMSVIVSRALPDVRDGLKPVHRRILYAMHDMGLAASKAPKKSARIVGEVLGKYHPHGDTAVYDSMVRMAQDFSLRYMLVNGQGNFGCFTKDTKVQLTDGRQLSFEDLVAEEKTGKKNYTYTVDENAKIKIALIEKPRLTKKNAQLIKVTLDNGEEIRCTLNHKFMLRTGKYVEAQNLKAGDSLMPLYVRPSTKDDTKPALVDYPMIFQPASKIWTFAHHLADEYNIQAKVYKKSEGRVRHHKDFNKLNADPANIQRMDWKEHWLMHSNLTKQKHQNDKIYVENIAIGREKFWSNPENWLKYSQRMSETNKANWQNPQYKAHMRAQLSKINLEHIKKNPHLKKQYSERATKTLKKLWADPNYRKQRSVIVSQINKKRLTNATGKKKFLAICKAALLQTGTINKETYDEYRLKLYPYGSATTWETGITKYYPQSDVKIISADACKNHSVVSTQLLPIREDVYDLTISGTHNFALAAGIFVHNSVDGDGAAAMRYTEARLTKIAEEILADIDKETVAFTNNFDESLLEPVVLPSKVPNLLINGSVGIAVGMATNVPPHNLTEVGNAVVALIDKPDLESVDLMEHIKGPDFPTAGIIYGKLGLYSAYKTGHGRITVRARTHEEEVGNRHAIIIDEIPYQVNKSALIEEMAQLVRDKVIEGIHDIRDESDRDGMRIVIELKKDAVNEIIINQLFKHTRLQVTVSIMNLCLVNNIPRILTLKEIIQYFIDHRFVVITKRTQYELTKAQERAHVLLGLKVAIDNLDQAIALIKKSPGANEARAALIHAFPLDEIQAQAILDMKLQRLTGLEREKIIEEHKGLLNFIKEMQIILASREKILAIIKSETQEIVNKFGDKRKTEIVDADMDVEIEDLIEDRDDVVTITHEGYIKRVSLDTYRSQKRGGRGIVATTTKDTDFVEKVFVAHTKSSILFFTNHGQVHWLKVYQVPEGARQAKGKAVVNLLSLSAGERVTAAIPVKEFDPKKYLILCTKQGTVKKSSLQEFANPRNGGIRAIKLVEKDELIKAELTDGTSQVLLATKKGIAVRFDEADAREVGRVSQGVRGIKLEDGDEVIGMVIADDSKALLTITANGFGKRTEVSEYRLIGRGGKGVINIQTTDRNGDVVAVLPVDKETGVLFMSKNGITLRTRADGISLIGRNTQGVRLMRLDDTDMVVSATIVPIEDEVIGVNNELNTDNAPPNTTSSAVSTINPNLDENKDQQ